MQHVARHVVIADDDGWSASHHAGSRSDSCKDLKRIASMQSTGQAAISLTTNPFALLEDSGSDDTKVDAERDIEDPTSTTMHTVMDELHHSPTSFMFLNCKTFGERTQLQHCMLLRVQH
jgi:hypothetical protein